MEINILKYQGKSDVKPKVAIQLYGSRPVTCPYILQYKGKYSYQYQLDNNNIQEKPQPVKSPTTTSETGQDKKVRHVQYNAK